MLDGDHDPALAALIASLASSPDPNASAIGSELEALEAIYPGSISLPPSSSSSSFALRYEISLPAWEDATAPRLRLLVTLPPHYPDAPPALQIMGRYVGAGQADAVGEITRTYISASGVGFTPGVPAVFDGLVYVQSLVEPWYAQRAAASAEAEAAHGRAGTPAHETHETRGETREVQVLQVQARAPRAPLPKITSSEAITDRKSQFVGHACAVADEEEVMAVVAHLLEDKRIARAAHPTIWAYRTVRDAGGAAGRIVESDYDDDGETQAGSRLKHLLEVLDLTGVLVVVTRWFGGIHLGPDRFKHINQAARDALEAGGFLDDVATKKGRRK
ncbi:uncharacterized protein COLE_06045 [Cutaneotrichosporon oleaginosum]|uniref:uncharacterized protein n=1 Tax=Cutaneotrichosporon oleaginosum TaxID=879819 RepID=UPI0013263882|nr:hypothetical protein COLE_06045 [Cutaneotrichosporon oleaginosum]